MLGMRPCPADGDFGHSRAVVTDGDGPGRRRTHGPNGLGYLNLMTATTGHLSSTEEYASVQARTDVRVREARGGEVAVR